MESPLKSRPYLFCGAEVIERFRKRIVLDERRLTNKVTVTIHDSDPMYLAVIYNENRPVATEGSIPQYEVWLDRAATDNEFLSCIESL